MVENTGGFKIVWLGPTEKKENEFISDGEEALKFFNSINWVENCIEYWKAHAGSNDYFYNEDWSLNIKDQANQKCLEVFVEYHNEIERTNIEKIRFVAIYSWKESVESSWFEKKILKKEYKVIDENSHLPNMKYIELKEIVENFLQRNFDLVREKVNHHYNYFDED